MRHVSPFRYAKIKTNDIVITDFNLVRHSYICYHSRFLLAAFAIIVHNYFGTNRLPLTRRCWQCFHTEKCHKIITISFKPHSELFWRFSKESTVTKMRQTHHWLQACSQRQNCVTNKSKYRVLFHVTFPGVR